MCNEILCTKEKSTIFNLHIYTLSLLCINKLNLTLYLFTILTIVIDKLYLLAENVKSFIKLIKFRESQADGILII